MPPLLLVLPPPPPVLEAASVKTTGRSLGCSRLATFCGNPLTGNALTLSKKLVGQKVHVHIDYIKGASDGLPDRTCATVKFDLRK